MVLRNIKPNRSVIPDYCTSFVEQAEYISEYVETVKNEFFQNIGINELAVYESTGEMVVYEGEEKKAFVEKVKKLFGEIWSAIKAGYEKILEYFEAKYVQIAKKIGKVTKDDVDYLKDGIIGKTHEYEYVIGYSGLSESEIDDIVKNNKTKDSIMCKIFEMYFGENIKDNNGKVSTKAIREFMMGKTINVDKAWLKNNFDKISYIVQYCSDVKEIKKYFKIEKSYVDKTIKKLTSYNGDDIKDKIIGYKNYTLANHTLMSINLDVSKKRLSEYSFLLAKVAIAANKIKKKGDNSHDFKDENVEESYQVDMVKEAFNW